MRSPLARITALAGALVALSSPVAAAAGTEATQRALAREMARAGAASGALVVDLDSSAELYAARPDTLRMPASVQKLFVSTAALRRFGAQTRFGTDALAAAAPDPLGVVQGDL